MYVSIPNGSIKRNFGLSITETAQHVSIPNGSIKRRFESRIMSLIFQVSIPNGSIKRHIDSIRPLSLNTFQFLMVQLKGR